MPIKEQEDAIVEEVMRKSDSEDSEEDEEDFIELSQTFRRRNKQSDEFATHFELLMKKRTREMQSQQSQTSYLSQLSRDSQLARLSQVSQKSFSVGDSIDL